MTVRELTDCILNMSGICIFDYDTDELLYRGQNLEAEALTRSLHTVVYVAADEYCVVHIGVLRK